MKTHCIFLVLLGCVLAGCESPDNPYGFTWAVSTLAYTGYDAAKSGLMKHVYAVPGTTFADFETVIEKTEKISSVPHVFDPSANPTIDHSLLFRYEGRQAIYYGRFVQVSNNQSDSVPIFSAGEITNLTSFVAKLKSPADPVSAFLISKFSESARLAIAGFPESGRDEKSLENLIVNNLNTVVLGPLIYETNLFLGVALRPGTHQLLKMNLHSPPGLRITREQMIAMLNRVLLEDAYPSNLPIVRRKNQMRNYVAVKY